MNIVFLNTLALMSNQQFSLVDLHSSIWFYRLPQDVNMTENVNDHSVKAELCDHYRNVSFFLFFMLGSCSSKRSVFFQPVVTAF